MGVLDGEVTVFKVHKPSSSCIHFSEQVIIKIRTLPFTFPFHLVYPKYNKILSKSVLELYPKGFKSVIHMLQYIRKD